MAWGEHNGRVTTELVLGVLRCSVHNRNTFRKSDYNGDISKWDTSKVTIMK